MNINKQLISTSLVATMLFTMTSPALALNTTSPAKKGNFTYNDTLINYEYREQNGIITYVKVENDVAERIGNQIYLNGEKIASITSRTINLAESTYEAVALNDVQPCTGWVWSETGNSGDYSVPGTAEIHDVALEKTIKATTLSAMASIVIIILPISAMAKEVAQKILDGVTGAYIAYQASKHIYCLEMVRKHKYNPSFQKMVESTFYYDKDLRDQVPGSNKTVFGWWG